MSPNSPFIDTANLNRVHLAIDRGLMHQETIDMLSNRGGLVLGTVPKTRRQYPFKTVSMPVETHPAGGSGGGGRGEGRGDHGGGGGRGTGGRGSAQVVNTEPLHTISEFGARSAYWVFRTLAGGKKLFMLALRTGTGKVVYLATTDPHFGPNQWTLERASKSRPRPRYILVDEDQAAAAAAAAGGATPAAKKARIVGPNEEDPPSIRNFLTGNERKVVEITTCQNDAIWFLFRCFRLTSHGAGSILGGCFRWFEGFGSDFLRSVGGYPDFRGDVNVDHPLPDMTSLAKGNASCTLAELKAALAVRGISGFSGITWANAEKLQSAKDRLEGYVPDADPTSFLRKSLCTSWFLTKIKSGNKTKACMEAGTRNEPEVLSHLLQYLSAHSGDLLWSFHGSQVTIDSQFLRTLGLVVASEAQHYLATSVDGLIEIRMSKSLDTIAETARAPAAEVLVGPVNELPAEIIVVAAVEVKTRTTVATREELQERSSAPNVLYPKRIGAVKICYIDDHDEASKVASAAEFRAALPIGSERQQV